jgi:hypothetical protein
MMAVTKSLCLNQQQQQEFYSQASWGRLEIKSHEPKKKQVQIIVLE